METRRTDKSTGISGTGKTKKLTANAGEKSKERTGVVKGQISYLPGDNLLTIRRGKRAEDGPLTTEADGPQVGRRRSKF